MLKLENAGNTINLFLFFYFKFKKTGKAQKKIYLQNVIKLWIKIMCISIWTSYKESTMLLKKMKCKSNKAKTIK